ncbi:MAG: hypothetical protein ACOVMQ_04325 [Cyclobacteriaceae bacterium]|jgi:hypothetical protein
MRKTLLLLIILGLGTSAFSQEYKKLRLLLGLGIGSIGSSGPIYSSMNDAGIILIFAEPSYRISQRFNLGLRLEAGGHVIGGGYAVTSYGIGGQYYFSNSKLKPFCGIGLANYHPMLGGGSFYSYGSRNEKWVLGVYPRVGFDFGHLTVMADYNFMPLSETVITYPGQQQLPSITDKIDGTYFGFKIGVSIGGGRKK